MTTGMVTEVGELVDVFKKNLAYGKPIDWVNVEEEVADVMWYLVNFCRINHINLEKALYNNIQKLKVRFPDKFTGEAAINRDTTKERVELEK
ncbi:MazG nucleotide pyrophosphohydrolase domain-containing protein [Hymenobacter sp. M29]|uniref:MazG nucleotide pyrophosphohydrolase domain-containing protein n=1 Tax=Hymenobacter mellowenesis TaxID=3063995 RepID=A0ABT9AET0_9BACT|nr:MazG nucleotide pyrophosphohydrolase domain-containing protein [Hymenobacter sp. M29]MDO7847655.1 MazG nucleotide pyrophosphohydrolase domain-containing protein [Hymenobacter sp. M29]